MLITYTDQNGNTYRVWTIVAEDAISVGPDAFVQTVASSATKYEQPTAPEQDVPEPSTLVLLVAAALASIIVGRVLQAREQLWRRQ